MSRFAEGTDVPAERSRGEIERILTRYGATAFMYGWEGDRAIIGFKAHGKLLRFVLPMPNPQANDFVYLRKNSLTRASKAIQQQRWEQACRQRWRALALAIKAKLEAVESGITAFESEFLAHIVLPGTGRTVAEQALPMIEQAYQTGQTPPLLLGGPS